MADYRVNAEKTFKQNLENKGGGIITLADSEWVPIERT